jgi:Flp pilus assembly pilin Flp
MSWTDDSGAMAVEYGLIAALIGVGIIAGCKPWVFRSAQRWAWLEVKWPKPNRKRDFHAPSR